MNGPPADNPAAVDVVSAGPDGAILHVRVRPRSSRRGVLGIRAGSLVVGVGAPAERGRATEEALRTVASWLDLPPSRLRLVSGRTAPKKRFGVSGETPESLRRRVAGRLHR